MSDDMWSQNQMPTDKILNYEAFLNEKLKDDLRRILENRDKVFAELSEYLQLKQTIEALPDPSELDKGLKTKVDLGCNFYVQAEIPDPSMVFVHVGFGFFVEFTHKEALKFIEKKSAQLTEDSEQLTKDASKVKATIKMVIEGLRELQLFDDKPDEPPKREML